MAKKKIDSEVKSPALEVRRKKITNDVSEHVDVVDDYVANERTVNTPSEQMVLYYRPVGWKKSPVLYGSMERTYVINHIMLPANSDILKKIESLYNNGNIPTLSELRECGVSIA